MLDSFDIYTNEFSTDEKKASGVASFINEMRMRWSFACCDKIDTLIELNSI